MTTTLDPPVAHVAPAAPAARVAPDRDRSTRRDNWAVVMFGIALSALMFSVIAIGFGLRAVDESKHATKLAAAAGARPAVAPAPPVPATLTSVELSDMKVTPSATEVAPGKYTVTITNTGATAHELLVFHTDIPAANLPIGADGKVAEDAPGFKTSDGDNLDPAAHQTRVIDLTQTGTYLFVCNLPGHFAAGMHTAVIVK